jgi:hypothetical protein
VGFYITAQVGQQKNQGLYNAVSVVLNIGT